MHITFKEDALASVKVNLVWLFITDNVEREVKGLGGLITVYSVGNFEIVVIWVNPIEIY